MGIYPRAAVTTAYHATGIPNNEAYAPRCFGFPQRASVYWADSSLSSADAQSSAF